MMRGTRFVIFAIAITLIQIPDSFAVQNYFCATEAGDIYKEKNLNAERVGKYIPEEFFPFSYEKDGWIGLWRMDSKKGYQRITYTLEKNGIIVTYDRLLQLAEESNKQYDKPETIKPERETSPSITEIRKSLMNKEVRIGMKAEQVVRISGKPKQVNENVRAETKSEQWVYGPGLYLYFENGILSSYSLSR